MSHDAPQLRATLLLISSIVLSACGQIFMKLGMLDLHEISPPNGDSYLSGILSIIPALTWIGIGIGSYGISLLAWLGVLARYELSFAYPMLSMSYVLVYLVAVTWHRLGETTSPLKTVGILLIIIGVILITYTRPKKQV
jgi:undecaprenyl phosphate-alpha-L-ara4N flippase subunit ArnF